ncbi:MAG: zf-TFIIB domain-containing protein [Dehalococcoidales bacterium]|nr:zf-TFIIB domain-containing protein [Dehalococcoidales bacterium]
MRCPVDKSDMIIVEHNRIELDFCLECSGVWFDSGEIDLLVSALKAQGAELAGNELLETRKARVSEAGRKCPICRKTMDKVWIGKEDKVLIDSCPSGDGLWFDGGELHQVLEQVAKPGSIDVISFLGEAFKATHK